MSIDSLDLEECRANIFEAIQDEKWEMLGVGVLSQLLCQQISSFGYKYSEDEFRISNVFALNIMKSIRRILNVLINPWNRLSVLGRIKWSIIGLNDANAYMERAL